MGYYTSYSLVTYGKSDDVDAFEKDLLEISKYKGQIDGEVEELIKYGSVYAKLYDLEAWIDTIAPKHPNVLICLFGDGEESDDMWEKRWKGKIFECQRAIIPPFETKELMIH